MAETEKSVILAAGGTGGHMFPAQSVAEAFAKSGWRVVLTTDDRGMRFADQFSSEVEKVVLPSASFSQGSILKRLLVPFKLLKGVLSAHRVFRRSKASIVIGFGGYPSVPSLFVARASGIPYYIHEQNAVLGRVNRFFQAKARKVACGLWPVVGAGENAIYIGNPVRSRILDLQSALSHESEIIEIVVFGGSQGASVFTTLMPEALRLLDPELRSRIHLTQQVRAHEQKALEAQYNELNIKAELAPFFKDLPERIARSHFVVARSGASTLAELQIIGRGSILVPLPTAMNDHQRLNAKSMVAAGAALQYDEGKNTPKELAAWLKKILTERATLAQMSQSASALARPNAAQDLVNLILKDLNL